MRQGSQIKKRTRETLMDEGRKEETRCVCWGGTERWQMWVPERRRKLMRLEVGKILNERKNLPWFKLTCSAGKDLCVYLQGSRVWMWVFVCRKPQSAGWRHLSLSGITSGGPNKPWRGLGEIEEKKEKNKVFPAFCFPRVWVHFWFLFDFITSLRPLLLNTSYFTFTGTLRHPHNLLGLR